MSGHGVPHSAATAEHKRIGISIAIVAVVVAVVTALAQNEANQMIVKEVRSSNGFSWYQAKRQRGYLNELEIHRIEFEMAGTPSADQKRMREQQLAKLKAKNAEYEAENKEILAGAEADKVAAEVASHRHHWFEYAEILLHIGVVLCSLTLLTDLKLFYRLGLAAAAGGIVLGVVAFNLKPPAPHAAPTAPNTAPAK